MAKTRILFLLALFMTVSVSAQTILQGTLRGANDKQPILYANVALLRAADSSFVRGTVTDDKGQFSIQRDSADCLLRISAMGYATLYQPISVSQERYDLLLQPGATDLKEVKVSAQRPLYSVDGEKALYNVSEDASVQTGTASDVLQNAPGVEVDVEGNITLNGSASVDVWINDRPSHLSGESLKQYIKTLPANSIDRVEVMRNPSARYGGGAPVINIITNQRILQNSFFSFGANGSTKPSLSPWVSYVYTNDKLSVNAYVSGNANHQKIFATGAGRMFDNDSNLTREYDGWQRSETRSFDTWVNLNLYYEFDTLNSLAFWFGAYPSWRQMTDTSHIDRTEYLFPGVPSDYGSNAHNTHQTRTGGGFGGFDFTHKFNDEGHQISFNTNVSLWGYRNSANQFEHFLYQPQLSYDSRDKDRATYDNFSLGVEYTYPYSEEGELEMGAEFLLGRSLDLALRDTLATDGNYYCDVLRSDTNVAPSQGLETYLTWSRKWGNFTLKLGGRLSYEHSSVYHEGLPEYDTSVHFLTFLPSLHMSYRTESGHNFSFGYTYHVSNPEAVSLCRYVEYGVESVSTGNPLLLPEYIHNADFSWNKYFDKFGSVGLSGSFKADLDQRSTITDVRYVPFFGRYVDYSSTYNAGDSRRGDLSVNCTYRPTAFFNLRLSAGLTDSWYRVQVRPDKWVESELLSCSVRAKLWTKLWQKLELFATAYYNSSQHGWEILEIDEPRKGLDLGMSTDLLNRKLSLYLNMNDVFNTSQWSTTNINPYNSNNHTFKYTTRYLTFGATLRFGKMELEGQARTGATESNDSGPKM